MNPDQAPPRHGAHAVSRRAFNSPRCCRGVHHILYADPSAIGSGLVPRGAAPTRYVHACQIEPRAAIICVPATLFEQPSAYPRIISMVANSIRLVRCSDGWRERPEMAVDASSGRDNACIGTLCGVSIIHIASPYWHRKQGSSDQPRRQDLQSSHQPSPLKRPKTFGSVSEVRMDTTGPNATLLTAAQRAVSATC